MTKFRARIPKTVEAIYFTEDRNNIDEVIEWATDRNCVAYKENSYRYGFKPNPEFATIEVVLHIHSSDGWMELTPGLWVLWSTDGRIEELADEDFKALYEPCEE